MSRTRQQERAPASYRRTGVLTEAELGRYGCLPSRRRLRQGPVAVVECVECIPCDPCAHACPRGAITISGQLTNRPTVDSDNCSGCGLCVARCPGLAVFVVNAAFSRDEALVTLPCELLPRPRAGQQVVALNRAGRAVGPARVVKVLDAKAQDRCAVIIVAVARRLWSSVRAVRLDGAEAPDGEGGRR